MTTEKTEGLDLRAYPWPKVTGLDVVFPTANTDPKLLAEAKRRGYDMNSRKPGMEMFSTLFYSGGKLVLRKNIQEDYRNAVYGYFRSLIGSFAPKHEDKTVICAMLLDEIATGVEAAPQKSKAA